MTALVVHEGSLVVRDQRPLQHAQAGTALIFAPDVTINDEADDSVTVTSLLIDTDYLMEHLFWQHLDVIPDRDAARDLAARLCPDPLLLLRLGQQSAERLGPILYEFAARTAGGQTPSSYFRVHALLLNVLEALAPHIRPACLAYSLSVRGCRAKSPGSRWQRFTLLRREARTNDSLVRNDGGGTTN